MLEILHVAGAVILVLAHATFFLRGLYIARAGKPPGSIDRLTRTLSQILLPVTAFTGLLRLRAGERPGFMLLHVLLGLAPLAAIILVFLGRLVFRKRTEAPWLLPALNMVLMLAALATGFALARGQVWG